MATWILGPTLLTLSVAMYSFNIYQGRANKHRTEQHLEQQNLINSTGRTQGMRILLGLLYWTGVETIIV